MNKKNVEEIILKLSNHIKDMKETYRNGFNKSKIKKEIDALFDNKYSVNISNSSVKDNLESSDKKLKNIDITITINEVYEDETEESDVPRQVMETYSVDGNITIIACISRISGAVFIKSGAKTIYTNTGDTTDYEDTYERKSLDICTTGFNVYYTLKDILYERAYLLSKYLTKVDSKSILENTRLQNEMQKQIKKIFPAVDRWGLYNLIKTQSNEDDNGNVSISFVFFEFDVSIEFEDIIYEEEGAILSEKKLEDIMKIYNKNSFNSATICFTTATIKDSVVEVDIKGNTFIRNESNGEDVACIKHRLIPKLVLNKESDIEKHNLECFKAQLDNLVIDYKNNVKTIHDCIKIIDTLLQEQTDEKIVKLIQSKKILFMTLLEIENKL